VVLFPAERFGLSSGWPGRNRTIRARSTNRDDPRAHITKPVGRGTPVCHVWSLIRAVSALQFMRH
jgi:hypothetical protein